MRLMRISLVAAALLCAPIIGRAQQEVPDIPKGPKPAAGVTELQTLVKTQTLAIQALHEKVLALEARVDKLEKRKPGSDSQ